VEILSGRSSASEGKEVDLQAGFLAPGYVNAHAHLELGALAGRLGSASFVGWIRELIENRAELQQSDFEASVGAGATRALETGTTTVGDIDSTGASAARAAEIGLRLVCFREVLDAGDPKRLPSAMRRVQRALPKRKLVSEGLSPHAPYTTSRDLLDACARLLERRPMPMSIHWAETEDEDPFLREGRGPFSELLTRYPRAGGLELLEETGLLGPRTLLVHANHASESEVERIARSGASVVHCPGTHGFFGRERFPLRLLQRAGVPLALGTDSLASNADLDMAREMRLALHGLSGVTPAEAFRWATEGGAKALGLADRVGRLELGFEADLVWHRSEATSLDEALETVAHAPQVGRVWVSGRPAFP